MTTPNKTGKDFDTAEIDMVKAQAKMQQRGLNHRPPAPAKGREPARPPESGPLPSKPAAAPDAPSTGLEQPAAEVCSRFPLGETARPLLEEGQITRAFLQSLVKAELFADSIKVLAHAVPKREAVWWACQCCRQGTGVDLPSRVLAALESAERWAADPTEENRRATYSAAEASGFDTPAGCAAVAAFWSGGSLGPPNVPVIPPGEWLTAHGVAGAVQLAVAAVPPREVTATYQQFLIRGLAVADGTDRWKAPPAAAQAKPMPAASRSR